MLHKMLLWKEARANRTSVALGVSVTAIAALMMLRAFPRDPQLVAYISRSFIYPLLGLLVGASVISVELGGDTLPFLLSLPSKRWKVWLIKTLMGAACVAVAVLAGAVLSVIVGKVVFHQELQLGVMLGGEHAWVVMWHVAFAYAVGLCASSLFGEPMVATMVGMLFVVAIDGPGSYAMSLSYRGEDWLSLSGGRVSWFLAVSSGLLATVSLLCFVRGSLLQGARAVLRRAGRVCWKVAVAVILVGIGAYLYLDHSTREELERLRLDIESRGSTLEIAALAPAPIPDEENAAILYQEAFLLLQQGSEEEQKALGILPWGGTESRGANIPALRSLLKKNEAALRLVNEATLRKKCQFPFSYDEKTGSRARHAWSMQECARLLAARAMLQASDGHVVEAVKTCQTGLRVGKALQGELQVRYEFARQHISSIMLDALERILGRGGASPAVFGALLKELDEFEGRESLTRSLQGDRAIGVKRLLHFMKDARLRGGQRRLLGEGLHPAAIGWWTLCTSPIGTPFVRKDQIYYLRAMEKLIMVSRVPCHETVSKEGSLPHYSEVPLYRVHNWYMLQYPYLANFRQARLEARIRALKLALSLKLYKANHAGYPESLASLVPDTLPALPVDPFTGANYTYGRRGEGFIVYSVGENLEGDAGAADDIVWRSGN